MSGNEKHVVIVGAGLSGLVSALALIQSGCTVTVIDKRNSVGGLCGTFTMDGFEFVTACNDFGSGLVKLLRKLGVNHEFEYKKSSVFYQGEWFNAAPDLKMLFQLRREWRNVLSLLAGILKQVRPKQPAMTIEEFANAYTRPGAVNDLVKMIAYFMGVTPDDIKTSFFGLDGKYGYGYTKMACPKGGPQALSDAIAAAFVRRGGTIMLNTGYLDHARQGDRFNINIASNENRRTLTADNIIDTTEARSLYPQNVKRGLPLSVMCLAVDSRLPYPDNTHTLSFYEPDVSDWFTRLDRGEIPERFGFHIFKSDLKSNPAGTYTMNAYFYLPRGTTQLDPLQRDQYRAYLLDGIEKMLPGAKEHVRYQRILTPDDFENLHGLSSRVMPFIGVDEKPANVTAEAGVYRAGHTVFPPGEHAGAAALSGYLTAKHVMDAELNIVSTYQRGKLA